MIEEWRPVRGYEGLYEVSSLGRVRGLDRVERLRNRWGMFSRTKKGRLLTPADNRGYLLVTLCKDGRQRRMGVHRLVCAAWHGAEPFMRAHAAHHDGNSHNNTPDNLRWTDARGNTEDRERHGRILCGEAAGNSRLTETQVCAIRAEYDEGLGYILAEKYAVSAPTIYAIVKRRTWKHI